MLIVGGNQSAAGGFNVANSLRFNDGSGDYLSFPSTGTNGNRKSWTLSLWFKRGNLGSTQTLFSAGAGHIVEGFVRINSSDRLEFKNDFQYGGEASPTRVLRDSSAWYHLVWSVDVTQPSNDDRWKIYLNGELIPASEYSSVTINNADGAILTYSGTYASDLAIGRRERTDADYWDGYIAESVLVEGSQLDPTSFGEFDEDSGIWKPIDVSGLTFGTNGFYLPFENSAALGQDDSGNGNNFTVNNIISTNQMTDTPTNNYCVANPLDNYYQESTFYEAGLKLRTKHPGVIYSYETYNTGTLGVTSGKWYWEIKVDAFDSGTSTIGIVDSVTTSSGTQLGQKTYGWSYNSGSGVENNGSSVSGTFASYTVGDIIGVYLDLDNNKLYFAKNGTIQNSGTGISITDPASTGGGFYMPAFGDYNAGNVTFDLNWGNSTLTIASSNTDANGYGNFEYDPSSGTFDGVSKDFYALNTKNLAEYG